MSPSKHLYIESLEKIFKKHACVEYAKGASKYMRNQFAFYGIKSAERRALIKEFYRLFPPPEIGEMPAIVTAAWEKPQREFQYFAMEFSQLYSRQFNKNHIDVIQGMILKKSWWDTVDYIACNTAGAYFKKYPEQIKPITERWLEHESLWLRRSTLLFQLKYKEITDYKLLFRYISRLKHEDEFFIRKAIGWSLRQYAKTDPDTVRKFVKDAGLKSLSEREALKHL